MLHGPSAKSPKGKSITTNQRSQKSQWPIAKGKTMVYKTPNRKTKIERATGTQLKLGVNSDAPER